MYFRAGHSSPRPPQTPSCILFPSPDHLHRNLPPIYPSIMASPLPASDPEILSHVQSFWEQRKPHSPIYQFLLSDIEFTHASKGLVCARLRLTKNHVNAHGGIHGSVSATIVDWMGGMAVAAWDNRVKTGVSTDIHVSYLSSAKDGDLIEIEGKASKVGRTLAFTSVTISKVVDDAPGPVVATGTHTKFLNV